MTKPTQALDQSSHPIPGILRPTPGSGTNLSFTATSAQTPATIPSSIVRLVCDQTCHIRVGSNPTAVTTDMKLLAGIEYLIRVIDGVDKIAAIRASADGVLNITPMT